MISASTIPSGGTSDFIPEMWHSIKNENSYECFVNEKSRLPFLAMPDAIKAINQIMSSKSEKIQSRIYNVTSFNPSASEFFQLMNELYPTAKISYHIGKLSKFHLEDILEHFQKCGLPTKSALIKKNKFYELLNNDKKNQNKKINLILLNKIGKAYYARNFEIKKIKKMILQNN